MTEQTRLWPDETFTIPGYRIEQKSPSTSGNRFTRSRVPTPTIVGASISGYCAPVQMVASKPTYRATTAFRALAF